MFNPADDIDAIQASLLRTLASAHRLRIIHRLGVGPCEVNEISRDLGLGQAATSQHLAAMRAVGLVDAVRDGRTMRYELCDPEILVACSLMRGALVRRLSRLGDLAAAAGQDSIAGSPSFTASSQSSVAAAQPSVSAGRSSIETPSSKVSLP
jgi:ArsR family transcriptional regulator, virulence genes transcriptional regulator